MHLPNPGAAWTRAALPAYSEYGDFAVAANARYVERWARRQELSFGDSRGLNRALVGHTDLARESLARGGTAWDCTPTPPGDGAAALLTGPVYPISGLVQGLARALMPDRQAEMARWT